ncbi:MAG: nuclear transport factor 2 family protein [Chloroflexota bacterium]|jgi:limonene-1,2-epoxide hydrolase
MSRIEAGIRTVLEFSEAFNRHDVGSMTRLMSDDCLFEYFEPAPDGGVHHGKEAITSFWHEYFSKDAEAKIDIDEIFRLGERCILRWLDENGRANHIRGVDIFRVRHGAIRQQLSYAKR